MAEKELPKVKLVPFGERLSDGRRVTAELILQIEKQMPKGEIATSYDPITKKELDEQIPRGRKYYFIENNKGEQIGIIAARFFKPEKSMWSGRARILPGFRGKGYATATYKKIDEKAEEAGAEKSIGVIFRKNIASRKAAKRSGSKIDWPLTILAQRSNLRGDGWKYLRELFKLNPYLGYSKRLHRK
ncbi:MAG: GNAT family N-acetyltransferase [Candidatus Diapherotrites archaeon]